MGTWILLITLVTSTGAAITTIDFASKEACEAAAERVERTARSLHALCVRDR